MLDLHALRDTLNAIADNPDRNLQGFLFKGVHDYLREYFGSKESYREPTNYEKEVAYSSKYTAIKMYHDRTGCTLLEAREAIESQL